ncbi:hypothetical protein FF2_026902 [Malus domestica]
MLPLNDLELLHAHAQPCRYVCLETSCIHPHLHLTVAWSLTLSCIFLTLSLRLLSSVCGFFMIMLHVLTIVGATSGCAVAGSKPSCKWYGAHMVLTVLTAIPRVIGGAGVHEGLLLQISCLLSSTTSMLFLFTAGRHLSSAAPLV